MNKPEHKDIHNEFTAWQHVAARMTTSLGGELYIARDEATDDIRMTCKMGESFCIVLPDGNVENAWGEVTRLPEDPGTKMVLFHEIMAPLWAENVAT